MRPETAHAGCARIGTPREGVAGRPDGAAAGGVSQHRELQRADRRLHGPV